MIINRILHRDNVVNHDTVGETPVTLTFPYISTS